jgi:hypothetical protein
VDGALELADGRLLSWSEDKTLRLWGADGAPLAVLEGDFGSVYRALELTDGRLLSWHLFPQCRLWSPDGTALGEISKAEASRLQDAVRHTAGEAVPSVEWPDRHFSDFFTGLSTATGAILCRFVADGFLMKAAQLGNGTIVIREGSDVLHFLRPNAALRRLMGVEDEA